MPLDIPEIKIPIITITTEISINEKAFLCFLFDNAIDFFEIFRVIIDFK
jgi:hypothetical protein